MAKKRVKKKKKKESINRKFKDSLFKFIFGNEKHKDLTLSLYNAINNTDYDRIDDIEITTIDGAVYIGMENDISFIIADTMNLYEQQSTYNPNMPLRMLIYAGQLYSKLLEETERSSEIYRSRVIPLPYPKLLVFYNGDRNLQSETVIHKLSQAFPEGAEGDIEVKVTMLDVNYGKNKALLQSCRPLSDYSLFTTSVRELEKKGRTLRQAVDESLELLPKDSKVGELIRSNKAAVLGMILYEYDQKKVIELREKDAKEEGIAIGREEGVAIGRAEAQAEAKIIYAKKCLEIGLPLKTISRITDIPIDELKKLK